MCIAVNLLKYCIKLSVMTKQSTVCKVVKVLNKTMWKVCNFNDSVNYFILLHREFIGFGLNVN